MESKGAEVAEIEKPGERDGVSRYAFCMGGVEEAERFLTQAYLRGGQGLRQWPEGLAFTVQNNAFWTRKSSGMRVRAGDWLTRRHEGFWGREGRMRMALG